MINDRFIYSIMCNKKDMEEILGPRLESMVET